VPNRAQGYTLRRNTLVRFSLEQVIQALDANGFGGIISNAHDLLKWSIALSDSKIIKKQTFGQMITPTSLPDGTEAGPEGGSRIGLGWFTRYIENKKVISHSGHTGTAIVFFPDERLIVVLLTNLGQGYPDIDQGFKSSDVGFILAEMAAKKYLKN